MHDDIARVYPELAHLIKWHLCSTGEPLHYIANAVYLASDRDCHGLRKGEKRQIHNGKTGQPSWELVAIRPDGEAVPTYKLPEYADGEKPTSEYRLEWQPWYRVGEGKERELDAARRAACWPEATDEELTTPGLEERLKARLPKLLEDFRRDVEAIGFTW